MDYGRDHRAEALAAEYVLGTLRGGARRRFETLLPAHPALRDATLLWRERLLPMTAVIEPVAPSPVVWQRIVERIDGTAAHPDVTAVGSRPSLWRRLPFWRAAAGVATALTVVLATLLANPAATPPPVVVVLARTPAAADGVPAASIIASISGDGSALVTRPLLPVALGADRSLELWAVPQQGAPRSLGLMPGGSNGTLALRGHVLNGVRTLAITVEPAGGSPTGAPTGPIVYAGEFTL